MSASQELAAKPDVVVIHHGSLVGMKPDSDAARDWIALHIPDDAPWLGGSLMVEARFADAILDGMTDDGLVVGWWGA